MGGKTSPPSHQEGAEARLAPGGRAKEWARRPRATCPPACPLPAWPGRLALAGSPPASSPAAASGCKHQQAPVLSPSTGIYSYTLVLKVTKWGESVRLSRHFPITQRPHHTPLLWLVQRWGLKGTAHLLQSVFLLCNGCSKELPTSGACPEDPKSYSPWLLCMDALHLLSCTFPSAPEPVLAVQVEVASQIIPYDIAYHFRAHFSYLHCDK